MSADVMVAPEWAPKHRAERDPLATADRWLARAAAGTRNMFTKAWNWVKRAFNWGKEKVVALFNTSKEVAVKAWDWSTDRASRAWAWMKAAGTRSREWIVASFQDVWAYIAPFRAWVTTPLRAFATGFVGVSSLMIFGTWITGGLLLGFALSVIFFDTKPRKIVKTTTGFVPGAIMPDGKGPMLLPVLTAAQHQLLTLRIADVDREVAAAVAARNKSLFSEYVGRDYLLNHRISGGSDSVTKLARDHKKAEEKKRGTKNANDTFIWTSVKAGMSDEDKKVEQMMENADTVVQSPNGVPASRR